MLNRAQTETLGFVLIFAIITASIGLVYASGFTGLDNAREFEQVNNAERAFEVFADNIEDLVQWNAPSRSTEIRLSDATLTIADPVEIEVNDTSVGFNETYDIRPVIYDAGTGQRVVYIQGTVIREAGPDAVVVRESSMLITEDRTVIPFIETRLVGTGSVGGSRTILIRAEHAATSPVYIEDDLAGTVWLNITSPWAGAWHDHFESKPGVVECELDGDTAACEIDTDRIYVTQVKIDLEIE